MTALAEVDVADAAPEIAGIYAEIAYLSGIPLPALIWRHLATLPGVLPAAWAALKPLYESGLAQEAAWKAVEGALAGQAAGPTAVKLSEAGLSEDTIAAYRRVLQSYNRSNPVNFVGVQVLLAALARQPPVAARPLPRRSWTPPAAIAGLVPMVAVADIPEDIRRLIDGLAVATSIDRARVVPSLYRHLVPWPSLLRSIEGDVAPRIASGTVSMLVAQASAALLTEAGHLAAHVGPLPALAAVRGVDKTLEGFSGLIPEMVVIGTLLSNALDRD